jgi:aquaporin NIP
VSLGRRLGAEALGTFALVFFGAGAVMVEADTGALGQLGVALAFGLAITTMIYALGRVSGAHFNPARSLGPALVSGELEALWVYLLAPLVGASLGTVVYQLLRGEPGALSSIPTPRR